MSYAGLPAKFTVAPPASNAQYAGLPDGFAVHAAPQNSGGLDSFVRSVANAATFNMADPIAAGVDAVLPIDEGSSHAATLGQRYEENRAFQRQKSANDQQAHPALSLAGSIGGGFLNPVTRALPVAKTLGGAAMQGAGIGAGYGLGGAISDQKGIGDAAIDTGFGAVTGGVLGGGLHGAGLLLKPAVKTAAAQALNDEGVPTTIGQSLGGTAQRLEDSHTSIPLYGDAIRDQQRAGIHDFNRASYNRVLEPLNLTYAPDGPVGNKGIQHIGNLVSKAYDHAFDGAVVDATAPELTDAGEKVLTDAQSTLTPERFAQFQKNVDNRVNAKIDQDGTLSGKDLIDAKNWFSEQSRAGATATKDEQAMASAYGGILGVLKQGIAATDPNRGALLKAADTAYSRFVRVAQAASSNNASGKEGIFTPNQLGTAVRQLDTSTRKMGFAKGQSPMQDLAQAGQQALSPTVPDSGTALRQLFEHPLSAAVTSPVWGAGRLLYTNTGQKAAKAVLFGAPNARKAIAPVPKLLMPGALSLIGSSAPQPAP